MGGWRGGNRRCRGSILLTAELWGYPLPFLLLKSLFKYDTQASPCEEKWMLLRSVAGRGARLPNPR